MTRRGESNLTSALAVLKRFPWVVAISLLGTWAGMASDGWIYGRSVSDAQADKLLITACLGISLLFSLALFGERFRSAWVRHSPQAVGAVLLLGYFLGLEEAKSFKPETWLRFWMYFVAAHLLVSFAPFLRGARARAFWQYNQALFLRITTSLIFSVFLFLGLSLAILALRKLLGLGIPGLSILDLLCLIAGAFNTWFFLAGVPGDFDALERQDKYPLSLKILSQYVFIPLVSLNVIILYAYAIKILADVGRGGEWPKPWIGYPFLAAGLCGILSLLLLHPVREEKEKPWVRAFTRWFYPAQWPLLIFLVVVLGHDVLRKGLRVDTYLFLVLAFWISGMAAYFTLGKSKNIKAVPVTLFLLCMLCSFGPWGVFSLTRVDQIRHLERLMAANGLLRDGRFVPATPGNAPSREDQERIFGILTYLKNKGGLEALQNRLPLGDRPAHTVTYVWDLDDFLRRSWSQDPPPKPKSCSNTFAFSRPWRDGIFGIHGYSFLIKDLAVPECLSLTDTLKLQDFPGLRDTDSLVYRCSDNTTRIAWAGRSLTVSLEKVMIGLEGGFPRKDSCDGTYVRSFPDHGALTLVVDNGEMKAALQFLNLSWEKDASDRRLKVLEFNLLFDHK